MPTVANVDGVKIVFYWNDHPPAHFHAVFAEHRCKIDIVSLEVLAGRLPRTRLHQVSDWARPRRDVLLHAWSACQRRIEPGRIE